MTNTYPDTHGSTMMIAKLSFHASEGTLVGPFLLVVDHTGDCTDSNEASTSSLGVIHHVCAWDHHSAEEESE